MEIVRVKIKVEDRDGDIISNSEVVMPKDLSSEFISSMLFWKDKFNTTLSDAETYLRDEQKFLNKEDSEDDY